MPAPTEYVLFAEEQSFRQTWLWALLGGTLVVLLGAFGLVLLQAAERGDALPAVGGLAVGLVLEIGVIVLMYVLKLTVRVDGNGLHVHFFPLVKKDIPLAAIARWEARTYHPILEYGGWGIRCGWQGWAYNVSGNRGVQLELTDGKRLLIGSQRPDDLAAAIERAKQHGSRAGPAM